jgi:PilZ domain
LTDEHRRTQRHRTLKPGTISFDRGAGIDCLVRNVSETGACLEVASPVGIPDDFTLVMKADNLTRLCRVAWRSARRIGVSFS